MDDADLDLAVEGIVWSAFGTSGQRCTAASRVIVHEAVYGELQKRLVARAEQMKIGPGWDPETDLGPVINQESLDKIHSYTGIGSDEGAKLLTGGEIASEGDLGKGFFYRPTIFADVEPQMRIAQEEIFGPTTALIPVKSLRRGGARHERDPLRALDRDLHAPTSTRRSAPCATSSPGSRTSTPARPAPRCTCRSAARRTPATATARPARPRSTSSRSGSRSTSTTPASCSAPRSTTSSSPLRAVRGEALHRRRRAREPRSGRLRLRARGRGRHGARGPRRGDRRRDEQRRRVQRPDRRAREGGRARRRRARGDLRLGADGQADARRVQGQERGAARALAAGLPAWPASSASVTYTAVRREHNKLADQLVNEALDAAK